MTSTVAPGGRATRVGGAEAPVIDSQYEWVKQQCKSSGHLFEDPEFPASGKSVYFSKTDPNIKWRRPTELCSQPKFVTDGASRFDLDQGALGDCWYIAGAATLATRPELFEKVVLPGQSFNRGEYCGVFRFHFWQYGRWQEVLVDDRLPTYKGRQLMFCSNREHPDEFWPALLEKAYAKLVGSYEAMEGGWTEDALVDFTGGIGHRIDLTKRAEIPRDLFNVLLEHDRMSTLMGCSIFASRDTMENELPNGLIIGHAYSITKVMQPDVKGRRYNLLRLRNPWGKKEWTGPWSDRSKEWLSLDPKERQAMGMIVEDDGEFWMAYEDWIQNYQALQMCFLPPSHKLKDHKEWKQLQFDGSWTRGVSAGGPSKSESYWTNPQYYFKFEPIESSLQSRLRGGEARKEGSAPASKGTVIISLMQKNTRKNRTKLRVQSTETAIVFDVYKTKWDAAPNQTFKASHYERQALRVTASAGGQYQFYREVTSRSLEEGGTYVIIPSTYQQNIEGEFLLRVFTEQSTDGSELDTHTEAIPKPKPSGQTLDALYAKHAGADGVIDARELNQLLNEAFQNVLGKEHEFDLETSRSLMAMLDTDQSGLLDEKEMRKAWTELMVWQGVFAQFDKDNSGYIDASELKSAFKSIGYNISRSVLKTLIKRYGGKECKLYFNEFVLAVTKVVSVIGIFPRLSKQGNKGTVELNLDELLQLTLFY